MLHTFRKRLNFSFILIILFMILSRLVWMQLRTYELKWSHSLQNSYAILTHDDASACKNLAAIKRDFNLEVYETSLPSGAQNYSLQKPYLWAMKYLCASPQPYQSFMNWQWLMVVLIILSSVFLSRILSGSWLVSLLIGATLLSRGSLLAQIGLFSGELTITCMISSLLCCMVHFLRTGSSPGVLASCFILSAGSGLSPGILFISLTILLYLPFKFRDFSTSSPHPSKRKSFLFSHTKIFGPIPGPLRAWIIKDRNSKFLLALWAGISIFSLAIFYSSLYYDVNDIANIFADRFSEHLNAETLLKIFEQWINLAFVSWDLHYAVSVIAILAAGISTSQKGHWALKETLYVFSTLSLGLLIFSGLTTPVLLSPFDTNFSSDTMPPGIPRPDLIYFANWLEPAILTLGIVCLYHMLKKSPEDLKALKKQATGE